MIPRTDTVDPTLVAPFASFPCGGTPRVGLLVVIRFPEMVALLIGAAGRIPDAQHGLTRGINGGFPRLSLPADNGRMLGQLATLRLCRAACTSRVDGAGGLSGQR